MVENKDVVNGVLGASSALAGLSLVFFGLTVSTLRSYQAGTPNSVLTSYKWLASIVGAAFLLGVAAVALCVAWLALAQHPAFRVLAVAAFGVQLALLLVSAGWVLAQFVWGEG